MNNLEQLQKQINFLALRSDSECEEAVWKALQLIHTELSILRERTAPVGTTPIDSSPSGASPQELTGPIQYQQCFEEEGSYTCVRPSHDH